MEIRKPRGMESAGAHFKVIMHADKVQRTETESVKLWS